MSEHALQSKCFIWHHNTYTEYRGLLFHVNNKARNAIEGNKFKALGCVAGVPDLIYIHRGKVFGIEMKFEDGTLSKEQKSIHAIWEQHGIKIYVCRSFEQFQEIIKEIHNGF